MIKNIFLAYCLLSITQVLSKMPIQNEMVSLKSECINVRVGPGKEYPITYRYKKKGYPVKVIAVFGTWRKVRDKDGDEGWISSRFISNKQTTIIMKNTVLYTKPSSDSTKLAVVEAGVVAEVAEICNGFIRIKLNYKSGWVKEQDVWRDKK